MKKKLKPRLLRVTTVPISLKILLNGQPDFFTQQGFEVLTASADGPEVEFLKKDGVTHEVIPMTRKITPLKDLVSLWKLIRLIRRFRPDIVHTHTPKAGLLGMMAARLCRVRVRMHTVAGLPVMEASGAKRKLLLLTEKITYQCATAIYPNSVGLKNFIEANIKTKTPLKIIGRGSTNGINTTQFLRNAFVEEESAKVRSKINAEEDTTVYSFVGRIVRDKGIHELTKAFQQLKKEKLKVKLILVGPFEQDLDPLDKDTYDFLQNDEDVVLAGFQSDVRPWIAASDIFVFPSYREGFPNVVLQACCMKVPAIVSDINGCNEIIQHDESGLIVPPKSVAELTEAMRQLASNRPLRLQFADAAARFVIENFDQQYVWHQLLKEYEANLDQWKPIH